MPLTLLFLHGWGFDATVWDPLAALLPPFEQARDDRGYFGAARAPRIEGPCLAVSHSFGTMRLLADPPPGLAGLVAINGFARLVADGKEADGGEAGGEETGVPARVLDRMIARFDRDPLRVLTRFRGDCGMAEPVSDCRAAPLRADLLALRQGAHRLPTGLPVLSLQAAADHLLDAGMRGAALSGEAVRLAVHPSAGHLLPQEAPAWCAAAILDFADALRRGNRP